MLKVIAQDFIRPDRLAEVATLYRELVEKTKQEPLCISYDLFINQKDPGHFVFVEVIWARLEYGRRASTRGATTCPTQVTRPGPTGLAPILCL